ncbi:hypothetical protein O1611_g2941 [Lasiodiplodia mahajangana]|uniref:Uncharacterized protein n=1 Tax=Lasiodiplodia mahajangana TaxID=1108764 RepID=A0ACC2JT46_9PEZI|nr:hypothetical protein O1611_g2941 [Lasiodiplodia mahajangana]
MFPINSPSVSTITTPGGSFQSTKLDVTIDLNTKTPRISVKFAHKSWTSKYYNLIHDHPFTHSMCLSPEKHGKWVSLRLPTRVASIAVDARCHGLIVRFTEHELASQWVGALLIWKQAAGISGEVYIETLVGVEELCGRLQVEPPRSQALVYEEPDDSEPSEHVEKRRPTRLY